jgi:PAS domain S-box-containing protein
MYWQYTSFIWVYLAAAAIAVSMGVYSWCHRRIPGAISFAIVEFSSAVWSIANVLEKSRTDLSSILFFVNVAWTALAVLTPATLTLALEFAGFNYCLTRGRIAAMAAIPVTMAALSWTNNYHGLLRHGVFLRTVGTLTVLGRTPGPLYFVSFVYAYCSMLAAIGVLIVALWRSPRTYRGQAWTLLIGLFIIVAGSVSYNLGLHRLPFDITSTMFVPAGLAFMFGLFRYRLFDIAPVAHEIVFASMRDSVFVLDASERVTNLNEAARKLLGSNLDQILGRPLAALLEEKRDLAALITTGSQNEIVLEGAARPSHFEVRTSGMCDRRGRPIGRLLVLHDISERKQAEEQMKAAKEAAESAARIKSDFLAAMSHEIRTPMNAVLGMTSLILETRLDGEQREMVEIVRNSGESLLTIINDILDFAKIESGNLQLEERPFDLSLCVEETLGVLSSKAAEKSLDVAYVMADCVPQVVIGDVTRVRQVLFNLVGNALKFTSHGEIVISISGHQQDLTGSVYDIHCTVRDTGIGIPANRLEQIFQPFRQLDASTTRQYGGTGLGLAISKRLCELMNGRIWVESQGPGMGSSFHFTFCANAASPQGDTAEDAIPTGFSKKLLLVVEDNQTNRDILTGFAQKWGMTTIGVPSGAEAKALLRHGVAIDVVVIDRELPGEDGLLLAQELQESCTCALQMISLSYIGARYLDEPRIFAAQMTKPVRPSQFRHALEVALHLSPAACGSPAAHLRYDPEMAAKFPLRILLAEDNRINQMVAERMLARLGYQVDVVSDGLEVLQSLSRNTYDVVLMDMQMPKMDGVETTKIIRKKLPRERQPAVIAQTAGAMEQDRERCLQAGMDHYISKPLRIGELVQVLGQIHPLTCHKVTR